LSGAGSFAMLSSAIFLGGWEPNSYAFWIWSYPIWIVGTIYYSIVERSRTFLVSGTLFLMLYILKVTTEFFSTGLGWPIALMLSGVAMIGAGYISLSINKQYFRRDFY
jgi:hypothetical protein